MQNALIIFENSLLAQKEGASELLEDLVFNLALQKLPANDKLETSLNDFLGVLERLDLLNTKNATSIIKALIKAKIQNEQNTLYKLISEQELIKNKIETQKTTIKNEIGRNFFELKQSLENSSYKEQVSSALNEAFLFELESLELLKEVAESAFIRTLERNEDIELTASEISKELIYNAICEAKFKKENIIQSSKIILNVAFDLAAESKNFSKDLCIGAIKGVRDGIELGVEKFKKSFSFCTFEEDLALKEKELIGLEDELILLLKELEKDFDEPIRAILKDLLENELDTVFAKFTRLMHESREQLILSLNELKKNPKIDDLSRLAQSKLRELAELERVVGEKYKDFNVNEAKKLGISLWEKAKALIKKA
ncbi:hypothetical protein [Campylobacter troglodytis]|uniref:hypothetical protein n=1 Tax=Campylobacter troglodytis TaxID=654363 RepID=UPI001158E6CA|nr:hypothetical protein [Campylobacter troglodytis]TQR60396.1 hypothetical protein DMC01_05745 [Campylobacter troglodytis]